MESDAAPCSFDLFNVELSGEVLGGVGRGFIPKATLSPPDLIRLINSAVSVRWTVTLPDDRSTCLTPSCPERYWRESVEAWEEDLYLRLRYRHQN